MCRISLVHTSTSCLFDIPSNIVPNTLRFPANIFHRLVTRVCFLCVPHVLSMLLFLGSYFVSTICYTFPHYAFFLGVCRFALVRSVYFLQLFVGRHPHLCSFRRMRQNIVRENLFFFFFNVARGTACRIPDRIARLVDFSNYVLEEVWERCHVIGKSDQFACTLQVVRLQRYNTLHTQPGFYWLSVRSVNVCARCVLSMPVSVKLPLSGAP